MSLFNGISTFQNIVPLSLFITIEVVKALQTYFIQQSGITANSWSLPDELGVIDTILTDKTGTLTQNEMIFKTLSMEHFSFSSQEIEQVKKTLAKEVKKGFPPMYDVFEKLKKSKKRYFRRE